MFSRNTANKVRKTHVSDTFIWTDFRSDRRLPVAMTTIIQKAEWQSTRKPVWSIGSKSYPHYIKENGNGWQEENPKKEIQM